MSADTRDVLRTFLLALRGLDDRSQTTPCQTPGIDHMWTSDNPEDRASAVIYCTPCPLRLTACMTYATTSAEVHHVWAGIDLTTTRRNGRKP